MSTMRVILFLGPTLPWDGARQLMPDVELCEPAARGDVLRAALTEPSAIGLIDGYFEHRLAVHHKEILWALDQGVAVYGASSMGALRAAELDTYGLQGVGAIYRAFANGALENDDEVAVAHGPAPEFRVSNEPLVNVRATLGGAVSADVISKPVADRLIAVARSLFYPERTYRNVIAGGRVMGLDGTKLDALAHWLGDPAHRIDQKRADAEELVVRVREDLSARNLPQRAPGWSLPWSSAWHELWKEVTDQTRRSTARNPSSH
jgi:hypothetical protein